MTSSRDGPRPRRGVRSQERFLDRLGDRLGVMALPDAVEVHGIREVVEIVEAPLDDAWMRDIGPTFVLDESGQLGAVDWVFNGWGAQSWATWDKDERIAAFVAERAGAKPV